MLIPFVFPIFVKLRKIVRSYSPKNPLFSTHRSLFSYLLCGILYLILKFQTKTKTKTNSPFPTPKVSFISNDQNFAIVASEEDNKQYIEIIPGKGPNPLEIKYEKKNKRKKIFKYIFLSVISLINFF